MKHGRTIAAILILLFASLGFGQEAQEATEKRVVATVDADGIQRVEITGGSYFFDPNVIVVKVNVPVELKVKKAGGATPHNIVLKAPEAGIDFSESLGSEPKIIQFTPTKTGKYPFACTKKAPFSKSHKDRGMHGVLEVVD
jgi:plastocyanin domain-containing protein